MAALKTIVRCSKSTQTNGVNPQGYIIGNVFTHTFEMLEGKHKGHKFELFDGEPRSYPPIKVGNLYKITVEDIEE